MPAEPLLTVFTSTVFADVVRIWFQCVSRAFPDGLARFEIFHDSDGPQLDPAEFPGATILHRTSTCREFHDAYNEAVQRCQTRYLAIIDSDVFWVSRGVWPRVQKELDDPNVAAVSCVSRSRRKSHGTYSVVLKPEIYREVMKKLPDGFFPRAESLDTSLPVFDWKWYDTGDVLSLAVVEAGYRINFHHMDRTGEIVRFFGVTLTRRGAATVGERKLAEMAGRGRYFWRGWTSNLALRRLHSHLFPHVRLYDFSFRASTLFGQSIWASPKRQGYRLCFLWLLWRSARKVEHFVRN
ncbi:MAG TPA: glycosyltransferase [Terriglobales bacterium]|nr:glycosyltransferase [Terriglobales bacterium]